MVSSPLINSILKAFLIKMFEVGKTFSCVRPHFTVQYLSQTICVIIGHAHLPGAPRRQCVFIFVTLSPTTAQHTTNSILHYGFEALADLLTIANDFQNSDKGTSRDPAEMAALIARFANF